MTYLTGKRFIQDHELVDGLSEDKCGVIISEPFREGYAFENDMTPYEWKTYVAVLWDDGSIKGAVDIEELKIVEEDVGYVVCTDWPEPGCETLIHETWWSKTTLKSAKIRAGQERFKGLCPRIGKVIFPFD